MVQQRIYKDTGLPDYLKWQILSFLRIEWPDGFQKENLLRDWVTKKEHHPLHYVLIGKNKLLVSYVGVVWKRLTHAGKTYKMYGLSGVFTYPQFRNLGYGLQLVKAAKRYIDQSDGDVALMTSKLKGFYEKAGFEYMKHITLLEGIPEGYKKYNGNVYMLFLSEKGKSARSDFETKPIYFGETMW